MATHQLTASERERSARNEITAPRIINYQRPGQGWTGGNVDTPEKAREWVRWGAANGIDGLKVGAEEPAIMAALLDEARKNNMGTTAHLQQTGVAQMNAIKAARLGLQTVTHYYGHFESLLKDYVVQPWPVDMNYNDEQFRFGQVARLWDKMYPPGSPEWKAYLEEHLKLGTVFDPTLTIYSAGRDVMRFREAEWHDKYQTYGFGYINEFEMLQEAGFHPLEVIQAATMNGALTLAEASKKPLDRGVVKPGMLADFVIVDQNPLENLKVLYGTGAIRVSAKTGDPERVGGVKWTIKDGVVFDAKALLADVAAMVKKP